MDMKMAVGTPVAQTGGGDALNGLLHYPSLLVKQKRKGALLELLCNFESNNKYKIYNPQAGSGADQEILIANENASCLCRQCCGNLREFEMSVTTVDNQEIVYIQRPLLGRQGLYMGFCCCCFDFAWQKMTVFSGANTANPRAPLGYVKEQFSCCTPTFTVWGADQQPIYRIVGDFCGPICCNYKLGIFAFDDVEKTNELGSIKKKWAGAMKELFTDADNFFVTFPQQADAAHRALLIGATFLVDFLYFENNNQNGGAAMAF